MKPEFRARFEELRRLRAVGSWPLGDTHPLENVSRRVLSGEERRRVYVDRTHQLRFDQARSFISLGVVVVPRGTPSGRLPFELSDDDDGEDGKGGAH